MNGNPKWQPSSFRINWSKTIRVLYKTASIPWVMKSFIETTLVITSICNELQTRSHMVCARTIRIPLLGFSLCLEKHSKRFNTPLHRSLKTLGCRPFPYNVVCTKLFRGSRGSLFRSLLKSYLRNETLLQSPPLRSSFSKIYRGPRTLERLRRLKESPTAKKAVASGFTDSHASSLFRILVRFVPRGRLSLQLSTKVAFSFPEIGLFIPSFWTTNLATEHT